MKQQIMQLVAQKGEGAVKEFIVKSISDLKSASYYWHETEETMLDCCPAGFHSFVRNQVKSLYNR